MDYLEYSNLSKKFSNKYLRYRICLEDPDTIKKALDIKEGDVVLSITSAGCNILNFLLFNPKKIISVDANPNQNYLLELKICSIKHLEYFEFLEILGITVSNRRIKLYNSIKKFLSKGAQKYFDTNIDLIKNGITYSGQHNIKRIGKIFRFFIDKEKIEKFFRSETLEEQKKIYHENIDNLPIRIFFKIVSLNSLFKNLKEINFSYKKLKNNIYGRYIHAFTDIPIKDNYFLSVILLGKYANENILPKYLQEKNYLILKDKVERIEIKTERIEEVLRGLPQNSITKFNLSTTPDFLDNKEFEKFLEQITRVSKNNGRFCYFSTKINKKIPSSNNAISFQEELSIKIFKNDRSMLYADFKVGIVKKLKTI